jgi:hypothetical protein
MGEEGAATLLLGERVNFEDRSAEVQAWSVPESDRYPDGVKYSLQYGDYDGNTIIRYDNFPDHPDAAHHHKHAPGGVEDVDFEGVLPLYQQFKTEVNNYGHDWN